MSYDTNPYADSPEEQPQPGKAGARIVYILLITALVASWAYVVYDWTVIHKGQDDQIDKVQGQYLSADSSRSAIQAEYNIAASRIDSLTNSNTQLTGELADRKKQIDKLKLQIKTEFGQQDADLEEARRLIRELKAQIIDLVAQIKQLKQQNQQLAAANQLLSIETDSLKMQKHADEQNLATTAAVEARLENIASTLRASTLTAIPLKNKGDDQTVEEHKAKRVELFRIAFQIDPNIFATTGSKDFYVCVTGPDAKLIASADNATSTFNTRNEGDKVYTKMQKIQYTQNKSGQASIDWKAGKGSFHPGNYTVQIYNNGFIIGQSNVVLK